MTTQEILEAARSAKSALALADNTARNAALLGMADALCSADDQAAILAANAEDMAAAKGHISDVMLDRLALTAPRIEAMAQGIREVSSLPDPVGRVLHRVERPNGLVIEKFLDFREGVLSCTGCLFNAAENFPLTFQHGISAIFKFKAVHLNLLAKTEFHIKTHRSVNCVHIGIKFN